MFVSLREASEKDKQQQLGAPEVTQEQAVVAASFDQQDGLDVEQGNETTFIEEQAPTNDPEGNYTSITAGLQVAYWVL